METFNTAPVAPAEVEPMMSPLQIHVRTNIEALLRDYYGREVLRANDSLATPGTLSAQEAYQQRTDVDDTVAKAIKTIFSNEELMEWIDDARNEATYAASGNGELPRMLADAIMAEYLRRTAVATTSEATAPVAVDAPEITAA